MTFLEKNEGIDLILSCLFLCAFSFSPVLLLVYFNFPPWACGFSGVAALFSGAFIVWPGLMRRVESRNQNGRR